RSLGSRGGEAGDQIRRARPGGDQTDARSAGHSTESLGDEGRVLLVTADDGLDPRIQQGIEDPVNLGTRHAEYMGDPLCLPTAHQDLRTAGTSHSPSFLVAGVGGALSASHLLDRLDAVFN